MPGYSVDRFPDLSAEDRDEYTCSICQQIFDTPVTTTCCLQTFCEDCIIKWLKTNTTCPYDRKPLTRKGLSQSPRIIVNTLGRFKIECDYWEVGCRKVIKLSDLPQHTVNCRYKLTNCSICVPKSEDQILAECRRHLSAPELISNKINADMTDKTLAIIRQQLREQNTIYEVCKEVVNQMELKYGSAWTCTADWAVKA
ncbi:unnamed protein product [Medioppia subpectinata]|uniref:RING-type domain-containing protein n=1 Tax=Medioppia subpectinata TaxID=1979941 RepID=A0A7R9KLV3_9ACAR|nr:unnamed protein product [Medioppia subpectinata]CAG2105877.1 unnamed protein product [Medioppia subpectinata]